MFDLEVEDNHNFIAEGYITHNSQGSTFNDIFIDGDDIMSRGTWRKSLYVGLTRASGNVYIKARKPSSKER